MAKVRAAVLVIALLGVIGVGAVSTSSDRSQPKFCSLEGRAMNVEWLTKDENCNWTTQDGTPVLDKDGNPVTASTPPDKLPDGWGTRPSE